MARNQDLPSAGLLKGFKCPHCGQECLSWKGNPQFTDVSSENFAAYYPVLCQHCDSPIWFRFKCMKSGTYANYEPLATPMSEEERDRCNVGRMLNCPSCGKKGIAQNIRDAWSEGKLLRTYCVCKRCSGEFIRSESFAYLGSELIQCDTPEDYELKELQNAISIWGK